jgi:hypothetical protein
MKSGGQIERMLAYYNALCSVLLRCRSPSAKDLLRTLQSSIAKIEEIRAEIPMSAKSSQIRSGLRQGLREMPLVVGPLLAGEAERERSELSAILSALEMEFGKSN